MRRRVAGALVGCAVLLLVSGTACSGTTSTAGPSGTGSAATSTPVPFDPMASPEQVPVLAREHLGESPEVRRIYLSRSSMTLQVRDPVKRENLDDYTFRAGEWTSSPVSVSVSEIEEFDQTTFTLGQVRWDAIEDLMQQALDGLDLEGEEITGVSIDRIAGRPPRIYIGVNGLRGSGRLIANADGTGVDVQRN